MRRSEMFEMNGFEVIGMRKYVVVGIEMFKECVDVCEWFRVVVDDEMWEMRLGDYVVVVNRLKNGGFGMSWIKGI